MAVTQNVIDNIHVGPGELVLTRVLGGSTITSTYSATDDGGVLRVSRALEYIEVAEVVGRADSYIVGEEASFEVMSLVQSASLIREALGHGTVTTTAAATSITGKDELGFGGSSALNQSSLKYRAARRNNPSLFIEIDLWRVVAATDIEKRYNKAGKTSYRVQFQALNDMSKSEGLRLGKITIETALPTA